MLKPGKLLLELRSSGPALPFNEGSRELVECKNFAEGQISTPHRRCYLVPCVIWLKQE
jgi:hypothetical protein